MRNVVVEHERPRKGAAEQIASPIIRVFHSPVDLANLCPGKRREIVVSDLVRLQERCAGFTWSDDRVPLHLSPRDLVVVGVGPDPKPLDTLRYIMAESSVMIADPHGPKLPDSLEMKRRVARIGLEILVVLVRKLAYFLRQRVVQRPKARRSKVPQISRAFPVL